MPPFYITCSRLLGLDFDGVLHRASDSIHLASAGSQAPVPAPVLAVQLKAQRRLVWITQLEEALAADPGVAILVHSTWRRRFDMQTLAELLGPLGDRVIIPPAYMVDMGAPAPEFIRATLEWVNQEREQARTPALGLGDLLVLDDRLEFFEADPELRSRLLLTNPDLGLSEALALRHLRGWVAGHWSPEPPAADDEHDEHLDAAPAPTPPTHR